MDEEDLEDFCYDEDEKSSGIEREILDSLYRMADTFNRYPDLLELVLELGKITKTVFYKMEPEKQKAFMDIITELGIGLTMERDDEDGSQADS